VKAGRCFLQSVSVLVVFSIARWNGMVGPPLVSASVLTAVLMLVAWRANATLADLGLVRADVGSGLRWGTGAFGIVLGVLVAAALLPATDGFLHDARGEISGGQLFYQLTVSILLVTAIPEEFAFRGVLLGSALRLWGSWRATLITSALFGLWHIGPTLHRMSDDRVRGASGTVLGQVLVVVGAVTITFLAGLVFCWLRLRSKSLIAPIVAHMATNGLALAVSWFVVH
jgi:membrane protease YdiL (CAAX protease family)